MRKVAKKAGKKQLRIKYFSLTPEPDGLHYSL